MALPALPPSPPGGSFFRVSTPMSATDARKVGIVHASERIQGHGGYIQGPLHQKICSNCDCLPTINATSEATSVDVCEEYALPSCKIEDKIRKQFDTIAVCCTKQQWQQELQRSVRVSHLIFLYSKYYGRGDLF